MVKNLQAMQETWALSLDWADPVEEEGYPLQYSCLGNPLDRGIWQAPVHGLQRIEHGWVTFTFNDSFRHL